MTSSENQAPQQDSTPSEPYTGQKAEAVADKKAAEKEKANQDPRQGLPSTVVVEEAGAPMELQKPSPDAKGPWIQYNGVGTVRIMDAKTWKSVGVDSDKYYEWNYLNKKRLPRSLFSDAELQYLLRQDGRFSLVEDQPEKESATTE